MSNNAVVKMREVFVPGADTLCQYIDMAMPVPAGAEVVRENVPVELIGGDTAIDQTTGQVVHGHMISLAQETLMMLHHRK